MVSKYIKALFLTLIVLAVGLIAISYLDDQRARGLEAIVEEAALDVQASQQLFLYESIFTDEDICVALSAGIESVVYFYPDAYFCTECASQAVILDSVVRQCSEARVFAFPGDLGIPVINLLAEKYGVEKYPTLIVNDRKFDYVVSEQELKQALGC